MELTINYPPDFAVRYGFGKPEQPHIKSLLERNLGRMEEFLDSIKSYGHRFSEIQFEKDTEATAPYWFNGWFPLLDGMVIYTILAKKNPGTFIEIGSGNSTKFARQAIKDNGLRTRIISIDPEPRVEIDSISDEIVRKQLENVDLSLFQQATSDDIVFFDGSHRCFQNSDVTVFFLDVLPMLPPGTTVGVHDIFWPHDYPKEWKKRYYNEQYVLGAYMLGAGPSLEIEFASAFASRALRSKLHSSIPKGVLERWLQERKFTSGGCLFFHKH